MPIDSHREVSVGLTHAILEALRMEGVANPEALLPAAGIEPDLLAKPENRIPFERQNALWALAVSHAPEPAFGLQFARSVQPTSFGVVGYMAMNCGSIGECLEAIVNYQFLAGEGGEFSLEPCGSDTALCYTPVNPGDPVTRERVVGMLAATVSFGRWLVGEAFQPRRVAFTHEAPGEAAEYEEFFGCPVVFGDPRNCTVYPPAVTRLVVPTASEDLLALLRERANRMLEGLSRGGIASRIASLLASQLDSAVPEKAVIAAQLGMSERTLQRRLREEGTTYQATLDRTRHYLARDLLRNTQIPLAEVAIQLGFSEPSTFFRAFKRWEGATPGQYREAV
jgi:AraC-like DNA-binding protein